MQGQPWKGDVIALALGLLMPLAYSPFDLPFLSLIFISALFLLWQQSPGRRACWRGWLFGFGMFAVGVYWVYHSMHIYGHVDVPIAIFLTLLLAAFLAIYPALAAWPFVIKNKIKSVKDSSLKADLFKGKSPAFLLLFWYPLAWTFFEWVRSWFLTGFPWLNLGYTQTSWPLGGLAAYIGVYGITWLLCISAGLLSMLVISTGKARVQYAGYLVLLWVVGWSAGQVEWTDKAGDNFRVSMVQGNVDQASKWQPGQRQRIVKNYVDATRKFWESDLVIWPETAVPVFYQDIENGFIKDLEVEVRKHKTELLTGMPVWSESGDGYYNSMVVLGNPATKNTTRYSRYYHKRHLVPFGEYVPLKKYIKDLMAVLSAPMADFSSGEQDQPLLQAAGHALGISICYEIAFGEEVIQQLPEARFLVNASNNAWFGDSTAPHQIIQMAQMRARETGRYVLSATNDGVTAIIDNEGKIVSVVPQFQQTVLTGSIQPRQGSTPYVRFGNVPVVGLMLILMVMGWWLNRRQSKT